MKLNNKNKWQCALELDIERNIIDGDPSNLRKAIQNGADLRIHTAFQHNEHIDTSSNNDELILEAAEFRTTYCIDNQWVAGIMTLRQPTSLPFAEFTQRPSMSFFMYNEDVDLCLRANGIGVKCLYLSDPLILHKVSLSVGGNYSIKKISMKIKSSFQLYRKHYPIYKALVFFGMYVIRSTMSSIFQYR